MTLTYIRDVPYRSDPEVLEAALRIFRDSRAEDGGFKRGNSLLRHCETVATRLALDYTLMDNKGGYEYALLYARVAKMFGALWYFSGAAQNTITYRHLRAELQEA